MSKPNIVIMSDSPMGYTGLGQVADKIAIYLHGLQKYNVAVIGWGYDGWSHNKPYALFPGNSHNFGKSDFNTILGRLQPSIVLTIGDLRMISYIANLDYTKRFRWVGYFPIDGEPLPYEWTGIMMGEMDYSVCFTQWGKQIVNKAGHYKVDEVVPLGIDTSLFYRQPVDQIELLNKFGSPCMPGKEIQLPNDTFIIGTVARNQPNKNLDRVLKTYKRFLELVPEAKSVLYLHTRIEDLHLNLFQYALNLGIVENIWLRKEPVEPVQMPLVYNMMDLFFLPSAGEGFCLPYLEAAACGVPVIGTEYAGPIDYISKIGCPIRLQWPNEFIPDAKTLVERAKPSIEQCASLLASAYRGELTFPDAQRVREEIVRYDWKKILPSWDKIIEKVLNEKEEENSVVL